VNEKPFDTAEHPTRIGPGAALARGLRSCLAEGELVLDGPRLRETGSDGSGKRGPSGSAEALVFPTSTAEVASVLSWCYEHDVPIVPRGGGTGLAGGAVPSGGVVISLEAMDAIRSIEPELWRMQAEAGVRTAHVHRVARENGLIFPPDPGASEQSTLGGNIATNAGGPHAFRHGVTGQWVTGLEAVLPPGEIVRLGGPIRKDVAGYDFLHLLIGSEGTLGIVTAAWLRLVPAPEAQAVVVCFYPDVAAGCTAAAAVLSSGIEATALEYLDAGALAASIGSFPFSTPPGAAFAVVAEADGHPDEVARVAGELGTALGEGAIAAPLVLAERDQAKQLWAWRDGVSIAVAAQRGGKVSEDVVVPFDRLAEAIEATTAIGREQGLQACSWGHAGDGNIHATFLVDLEAPEELERAERAAEQIFDMAIALGGSISGEHGIGTLKTGRVRQALDATTVELQAKVKRVFDPKLLLNPGKKVPGCGRGRI
jgi:glycolate oxidase subunit GlcD